MTEEELDLTDADILRYKAEKLIKKQNKPVITDEKLLLYELQIHQIELELQNEALRQANETAEDTLKKYTMLFDLAAMGYFLLEPDGTICELNFTGADMLHERRLSLKDKNFKLFVADKSKPVFNHFLKSIYSGKVKASCKIMLGYDDNPLCTVYMEGIVPEDEQNCLLSVVDLEKLKQPRR